MIECVLVRAAMLETHMMENMDSTLADGAEAVADGRLKSLKQAMPSDVATDEAVAFEARIEAGLDQVRDEMKKV